MVEACYLSLFALRDRIVPGVLIFGHCYDFPIPNGAHPPCAGPWLKPSLDFCNWSVADGTTIVHDALAAFRTMVKRLADKPANRFHLVDTQGTLAPADWANELHPYPDGFRKIAQKFADALAAELGPLSQIALAEAPKSLGRGGDPRRGESTVLNSRGIAASVGSPAARSHRSSASRLGAGR